MRNNTFTKSSKGMCMWLLFLAKSQLPLSDSPTGAIAKSG